VGGELSFGPGSLSMILDEDFPDIFLDLRICWCLKWIGNI